MGRGEYFGYCPVVPLQGIAGPIGELDVSIIHPSNIPHLDKLRPHPEPMNGTEYGKHKLNQSYQGR